MQQKKQQPKKQQTQPQAEVCCPYFDKDTKACSHPQCIRMVGFECRYNNRKVK
jgi:hypothetical protein